MCPEVDVDVGTEKNAETVALTFVENPRQSSVSVAQQLDIPLRPWSSWIANSDEKLNVNKPYVISQKTAFRKFCKIFCQFSRYHKC